jgi:hypothetical protein
MEFEQAVLISLKKWALKCAHNYKIAIPIKAVEPVLKEFPQHMEHRKELIAIARDICTEINLMKDHQIRAELEKHTSNETTVLG